MRVLTICIGSLAGLLLLSPLAASFVAESAYRDVSRDLEGIERATLGLIVVEPGPFERGFLASRGSTTFRVGRGPDAPELVVEHAISHGPVVFGKLDRGLVLAVGESTYGAPSGTNPTEVRATPYIRIESTIGLDGELHVEAASEPLPPDAEIVWKGLRGRIYARDRDTVEAELELPGLDMDAGDVSVEWSGIRLGMDVRSSGRVPVGSSAYSVQNARVAAPKNGALLSIRDLSFERSTQVDPSERRLRTFTVLRFGSIETAQARYANAEFRVDVRNVDTRFALALQRQQRAIARRATAGAAADTPGTMALDLLDQVMGALPELIAGSPELEVAPAHIDLPGGRAELRLSLAIAGDPPANLADAGAGRAIWSRLRGSGQLRLPVAWTREFLQANALSKATPAGGQPRIGDLFSVATLDRLVEAGYVMRTEDEAYQTDLGLQGGELTLNGKVFGLSALFELGSPRPAR